MADKYVKFDLGDGKSVFIETEPLTKIFGNVKASKGAAAKGGEVVEAGKKLSDAFEPLKSTTENLFQSFEGMINRPDEIAIELSVKITAEAGMIITKGSIEGNFKVSLKWTKEK